MQAPSPIRPAGVRLFPLQMHRDDRGVFTEIFRQEWDTGITPVQWSYSHSEPGTLRGVDVHVRHDEYFILVQGQSSVGLRDVRRGSATEGLATLITLNGDRLAGLTVPRGVAHGFLFHEACAVIHGSSQPWDPSDFLACDWKDPALGIPWPVTTALVSQRQAAAPSLSELIARLEPFQPIG